MDPIEIDRNEKIEIELLLMAIYLKYGYDFREYAKASIRRRVRRGLAGSGLPSISDMTRKLIYDPGFFDAFLPGLTVNVTRMFRNPAFFKSLRNRVIPLLAKKKCLKIWHAGCATGEEVYSLAVILKEEGLLEKTRIYATDADGSALHTAKKGIFPIEAMQEYTKNYQESNGARSFHEYYTARYDHAVMDRRLVRNIVFADHNLVTDSVFGEMDLILCRNVMIYFSPKLQDRVLNLFLNSLGDSGFLCLGEKETLSFSSVADRFRIMDQNLKIYCKI